MAFLKRTFRLFSLATLAGAALALGACVDASEAGIERLKPSDPGQDTQYDGAGGRGQEGPIEVPPVAPPDAKSNFADLCGGGCMADGSLACTTATTNTEGMPAPQVTCRIVATDEGASAACLPSGTTPISGACMTASDCEPGMGCVATANGTGVCRAYCCGDVEACAKGTYCAPVAMAEQAGLPEPLAIPVCVLATPCTLLSDETCTNGQTCTLVRADGTTSCVDPGPGQLGDPCPCAAGYVCSKQAGTCLKLCSATGSDCPEGMLCQAGSESFPMGFGTCVGK